MAHVRTVAPRIQSIIEKAACDMGEHQDEVYPVLVDSSRLQVHQRPPPVKEESERVSRKPGPDEDPLRPKNPREHLI